MMRAGLMLAFFTSTDASRALRGPVDNVDLASVQQQLASSKAFQDKVASVCRGRGAGCQEKAEEALFCRMLQRARPQIAAARCGGGGQKLSIPSSEVPVVNSTQVAGPPLEALQLEAAPRPVVSGSLASVKARVIASEGFNRTAQKLSRVFGCSAVPKQQACASYVKEVSFCLVFADKMSKFARMDGAQQEVQYCKKIDSKLPQLSMLIQKRSNRVLAEVSARLERRAVAPEDDLAQEMTHDLEMNFNKIAPFGKEDTAKELQDHAAKTQDTLVDAVENAEVAEIKRAVFRALTRLRAATIKEFDTIARLETQAIDAYNDAHHYRAENPLAHLHEDEAPVETDKLKSFH